MVMNVIRSSVLDGAAIRDALDLEDGWSDTESNSPPILNCVLSERSHSAFEKRSTV